jgi:SAM-dependent methyltransferase
MLTCSVCESKKFSQEFKNTQEDNEWMLNGVKYSYFKCTQCMFLLCVPIPSEEDLLTFYKNNYAYEWFYKNSFFKRIQARHRLFKIKNYIEKSERILDFGCGHGFFVEALAKKGLNSNGFDIGVEKIVNENGYQIVYKNDFSEFIGKNFDLITAWHVIEHMRDINWVIDNLKSRLAYKGKLIIALPNTGSLGFKLFKQKWGWIQQPYVHINHFNMDNLKLLLKTHGFEILEVRTTDTWDQNLYDLLITKLFYKNKSRNVVRSFDDTSGGQLFFRINQFVRLLFTPVSYLYSKITWSSYAGSELMVVAQKKE